MDDQQYTEQKARVERYTERWLTPLRLDEWHVACCWHREKSDEDPGAKGRPCMMSTEVLWQYNDATIHVYLPAVMEVEDDERVEFIVVHEYMHIYLNELRPLADLGDPREGALATERIAHEEHACTMLAKAFLAAREYFAQSALENHAQAVPDLTPPPMLDGPLQALPGTVSIIGMGTQS